MDVADLVHAVSGAMLSRATLATALTLVVFGCDDGGGDASPADAGGSGAADGGAGGGGGGAGCVESAGPAAALRFNLPLGAPTTAMVSRAERCPAAATLELMADGTAYTLRAAPDRLTVSSGAATLIEATWNAQGGVTLTNGADASVGEPLRPYLLLRAADVAAFDPVALALADWHFLSQALELEGADPDGNDPARDAAALPPALSFLQDHPLVMRMEKGDLPEATSMALLARMDDLMNDEEVVDFHHFDLCHLGDQFFTGHDAYVDRMEDHLQSAAPPLALPFGRMPWHEPGSRIPEIYATWSTVADGFYAEHDACDPYPRRACTDEQRYTVKFSDPQPKNLYACDPADRATWCDGLLLDIPCADELGTQPEDYLGCEDDDGDGLPDQCPYGLLRRFTGENLCGYATVDDLWTEMIDWHGQVHDRIGGAHGDHAMTASTPIFWLFHLTLGTPYEGYIRCP